MASPGQANESHILATKTSSGFAPETYVSFGFGRAVLLTRPRIFSFLSLFITLLFLLFSYPGYQFIFLSSSRACWVATDFATVSRNLANCTFFGLGQSNPSQKRGTDERESDRYATVSTSVERSGTELGTDPATRRKADRERAGPQWIGARGRRPRPLTADRLHHKQ